MTDDSSEIEDIFCVGRLVVEHVKNGNNAIERCDWHRDQEEDEKK